MRLLKKLTIIFALAVLLLSAGTMYLNRVVIPRKIKALIVKGIAEATQKEVSLGSINFNFFKGLVLRDLAISDDKGVILSVKEGSCSFLLWPLFKKKLIIPSVKIKQATLSAQRRLDNSLNFLDLYKPQGQPKTGPENFSVIVTRVIILGATVNFEDYTLSPPFKKQIKNINLWASLSLPASVKFKLKLEIPQKEQNLEASASGAYNLLNQELKAKAFIKGLSPGEFSVYYRNFGIVSDKGLLDAQIDLSLKGKQPKISGAADIAGLDILTPGDLGGIFGIKAKVSFDNEVFSFDVSDAKVELKSAKAVLENIHGGIRANSGGLSWEGLNFKYLGTQYKTSGALTNFQAPGIQFDLVSNELQLKSVLASNGKLVNISAVSGKWRNSDFALDGGLDFSSAQPQVNLNTHLSLNILDLKEPLKKFKQQFDAAKPQGIIKIDANISGNPVAVKSCAIDAKVASDSLSLYGFKSRDLLLNYAQAGQIGRVSAMHIALYDGAIDGQAGINLSSPDMPYWLAINAQGVKIEKLKLDTAAKDEDIAGTIQAEAKINGFVSDPQGLSGVGKIAVVEGKLWELDLFKGLGKLLFTRDFTSITFSEAYCDFGIQDKMISTDNLRLKSNLSDITGTARIGFDSSIDASLNVEILDGAPLTGTIKDITTAILGEAGKFGTIRVTGTLKEPKYKFQTAVTNILKGFKDLFFNQGE